jgi:hypothetical protein
MFRLQLADLMALQTAGARFFASPTGRQLSKWGRRGLLASILAFLVYQLSHVGWGALLHALPTNPWFYAIFVLFQCHQAFFFALAYRLSWKFNFGQGFIAFFKMCVLNNEVLGNTGEVYLFVWAHKRLKLARLDILRTIKDNAILCWAWDSTITFCLPAVFFWCGQLDLGRRFQRIELLGVLGAPVVIAGGWLLLLLFHRRLLSFPLRKCAAVSSVYLLRLLVVNGLLIVQWAVVLPGHPWHVWFTMTALRNFVHAIPMLPSNDLLFVGAGIELAAPLGIEAAPFAGMLLMTSGLGKILNLLMFTAFSLLDTDGKATVEDAPSTRDVADERLGERPRQALETL